MKANVAAMHQMQAVVNGGQLEDLQAKTGRRHFHQECPFMDASEVFGVAEVPTDSLAQEARTGIQ